MRRRRLIVCLAAATLALLSSGAAQAAPPEIKDQPQITKPAPAAAERGSRLPFSGLDLALLTAGGAPLLLIGASLKRRRAPQVKPAQEETLTLA